MSVLTRVLYTQDSTHSGMSSVSSTNTCHGATRRVERRVVYHSSYVMISGCTCACAGCASTGCWFRKDATQIIWRETCPTISWTVLGIQNLLSRSPTCDTL